MATRRKPTRVRAHRRKGTKGVSEHNRMVESTIRNLSLDEKIVANRMIIYNKIKKPRVGDFIEMRDGSISRFTHDWGEMGLQTGGEHGTFYLGDGYISYSGSLDPTVPLRNIKKTNKTRKGRIWIFHEDFWGAGRGRDFKVNFRVYRQIRLGDR